jgi:lipopolysaccharide/colanic/teichoic acid biosynthesis glycosyltransferase
MPRSYQIVKRAFDLAIAVPLTLLVSPLLLYCAIRIKLDSEGPVLYGQDRIGRNRRRFTLLKLRSMTMDADRRLDEVAALSLHGTGIDAGMFKAANDPRVTNFGSWIRRWSIDELPQLFNVLRGDMSLVGPRPLPIAEDARVGDDFEARYVVRPGMTGRWQVLGRSDIPLEDMVRLDYTYVMDWSLSEDFRLLLRTMAAVTGRRGAY